MSQQLESTRGNRLPLYQCSQCHRRFHRTEHLSRHVRSHTKQRPYSCNICWRSFGRIDILKKHEATHNGSSERTVALPAGSMVGRVSQACRLCSASKSKCSEQKPCHRCVTRGLNCEYALNSVDGHSVVQQDPSHDLEGQPDGRIDVEAFPASRHGSPTTAAPLDQILEPSAYPHDQNRQENFDDLIPSMPSPFSSAELNSLDGLPSDAPPPFEAFSFGPDWDMVTVDFSNLQAQFDTTEVGIDNPVTPRAILSNPQEDQSAESAAQHHQSPSLNGSWEPQRSENSEMEHEHLAAGEAELQLLRPRQDLGLSSCDMSLSVGARNSIISMILNTTSKTNAAQILCAFPSREVLNTLLRTCAQYWETTLSSVSDIVHLATLQLDRQRPELLGIMIAIGAIHAGTVVACKFGMAMQEVVRMSSFWTWEESNANFCDLSLSQAFLLQQSVAFFSGNKRKVALAEACSKCVQVLIRNGGHMRGAAEVHDYSIADVDSGRLDKIWRRWAMRESQRRLIHAAYIMDSNVSLAQNTQMISSFLDISAPLPASRKLWTAQTASLWRNEVLQLHQTPHEEHPVYLKDIISNMASISLKQPEIDERIRISSTLAAIWALIKECLLLSSTCRHNSTWSNMILSSRRHELLSVLKLYSSNMNAGRPEFKILSEALNMYTLLSSEVLVLQEVSQSVLSGSISLPTLTNTNSAPNNIEYCTALYHAGRVIHAARQCSPCNLGDVYASAFFQAVILLWWHGVISRKVTHRSQHNEPNAESYVVDDEVSHEHHVSLNQACPAVVGIESEPVPIRNSMAYVECVEKILGDNWKGQALPPDVNEFCFALANLKAVADPRP